MRSAIASIAALLLSVFILLSGSGLQTTLVPLAANAYRFDPLFVGLLGSSYFLGMAFGCVAAPWLIRRTGHIRAFVAGTSLLTAGAVLHALFVDPVTWNVLRFFAGFCYAGVYAVIESWLNDKSDNEVRGRVLALYNLINYAGMAAGQQFLGLYDPRGFELFSLSAVLISVAALPVALTRSASPAIPESPRLKVLWLIRLSPVAVAGAFTVGLANGAFWTLGPVYATDKGLDAAGVGSFITASILGAVIALWPAGRLSDRIDRRIVIVGSAIAATIAGLGLAFVGNGSPYALFGLAFLFGAGAMPIYSLSTAHAADVAEPRDMVQVTTGLLLIYTFGAVAGPAITAALIRELPVGSMFIFTAIVHAAMAVLTIYRLTRREAPRPEERDPFVSLPRTSPMLVELDPRVPDEAIGLVPAVNDEENGSAGDEPEMPSAGPVPPAAEREPPRSGPLASAIISQ